MILGKQKCVREPAWMVCRVCIACFGINPAHEIVSVTTLSHCAFLLFCLQISIFGQALALKTQQGTKHALFQTPSLSHKRQEIVPQQEPFSQCSVSSPARSSYYLFSSFSKCVKHCPKPWIYYCNVVIRKRQYYGFKSREWANFAVLCNSLALCSYLVALNNSVGRLSEV